MGLQPAAAGSLWLLVGRQMPPVPISGCQRTKRRACLQPAGPSGVSTNDIGDRLGLNMKRNEPRMKEVEARFGIKRSAINKVGGWRRSLASSAAINKVGR